VERTGRRAGAGRRAKKGGSGDRMNITVHIERLVLEGLPVTTREGARIQAALKTELARQLKAHGLPPMTAITAGNFSCGPIRLARESKPAQIGNQLALAVYSGLASLRPTSRTIPPGRRGKP
jgi:hypothetical protein